jgi:hypothetical protein
MGYTIRKYTRDKAKQLGVTIKPSLNKTKKLDVFQHGKKIASIGAKNMMDYPSYLATKGVNYANKRRRLYKMRHEKDRHKKKTAGYYADQLLW